MPATGISRQRKQAIENDFRRAGAKIHAGKYVTFGLLASLALSLVVSTAGFLALSLGSLLALPALFLIILAVSMLAFLNLPKLAYESSKNAMEADLPLAIRHAAIAISIRMPFEKVIGEIADSGYGCSEAFGRAKNAVSSGQPLQAALLGEASESGSRKLTRFASSIISLYEEGGEPVPLYMLADEYSRANIAGLKEFAQKAVFGGLVFVAAACIVPAFYMIYGIISSAMPIGIEPPSALAAWSAFLVIFPLIDIAILAFVSISIPPSVNLRKAGAGKGQAHRGISIAGARISHGQVSLASALGFAVFAMLGLANSLFFGFAALSLAIPLAAGMLAELEHEKKTADLESGIGDALVMASSAPKGAPIEKIAAAIASYAHGPVAEEFATVKNQISSGVSPKTALSNMADRTDSLLVHRCISLMLLGYKGGADMRFALRKVAEDVYLAFDQVRERKNAIAMQKYTLLAGSSILVPLVMGISMGMARTLGKSAAAGAGGAGMAGPAAAYMLIFAALAAIYCATLEGNSKKAITYFIASAPLALVVLIISSGAVG